MRIFKVKSFIRRAKSERVANADLARAIEEIEAGLVDADLGGGLVKKRIARQGQGKSSGYRTIIAFRAGERAFFLHGFAKNNKANVSRSEMNVLKEFADELMDRPEEWLNAMSKTGALEEISNEGRNER